MTPLVGLILAAPAMGAPPAFLSSDGAHPRRAAARA
jgi:hypothetical protein